MRGKTHRCSAYTWQTKPRSYRKEAHKKYLKFARSRKRSRAFVRKSIRKQLSYLSRNLTHIDDMLADGKSLNGKPVEFGAKLDISVCGGWTKPEVVSFNAYNEAQEHRCATGTYPDQSRQVLPPRCAGQCRESHPARQLLPHSHAYTLSPFHPERQFTCPDQGKSVWCCVPSVYHSVV